MAAGFPVKTSWAPGDPYTAAGVNDMAGTINIFSPVGVTSGYVPSANGSATSVTWVPQATVPTSYGFTAGKNAIINGDMYVNQRNFSTTSSDGIFIFDRFVTNKGSSGGTSVATAQTFTPGTAPVAGYEGANYLQIVSGSQSGASDWSGFSQGIENVRTYAGQTITISFWAKAASGTPKVGVTLEQNFGSGGSSPVYTTGTPVTISTSWARYTTTVTLPALTGKTIGSGSKLQVYIFNSTGSTLIALGWSNTGLQNGTFSYWGVQVEAGSSATTFQTATGTLQGELAACQRYYFRQTASGTNSNYALGMGTSTTLIRYPMAMPVTMRVTPTAIDYNLVDSYDGAQTVPTSLTIGTGDSNPACVQVQANYASGVTQYRPYVLQAYNSTSSYVGLSAEL